MLLVNGASGGVGTAAVQIGRALGARVVANVRNEGHRPAVAALGAEVFGADQAFARAQELGGADVILELVGAPHMAGNIASLARGGRLVVVASKPGEEVPLVLRDLMAKRAHLIGTTLRTRPPEQKGQLVQAFATRIVPLMAAGALVPVVDRIVPAGRRGGGAGRRAPARQARQAAARAGLSGAVVKLRRIDHVGIVVADLAAHVAQLQALGLSLGRTNDNSESHAEYFPCGDASVELIEVRDPAARERRLPAGEAARIEHIAFEVDSPLERGARATCEAARRHRLMAAVSLRQRRDDLDRRRHQRWRPVPVPAAARAVRIGLIGAGAIARPPPRDPGRPRRRASPPSATATSERARAAAAGHGAAVHSDWTTMLEQERLDAVLVCTPPAGARRRRRGRAGARARRLCREAARPRAWRMATAIAEAHAAAGVVCAVGYQWRSLDVLDTLRAALAGTPPGLMVSRSYGDTEGGRGDLGTLGERRLLVHRPRPQRRHPVRAGQPRHRPAVRDRWAGDGGAGNGRQRPAGAGRSAARGQLDDTVAVLLRFASGGIGSVQVGWNPAQDPAVYTLDVQAHEVALSLVLDPHFQLRGSAHGAAVDAVAAADPRESSLDRFLEAVRAGDPAAVPCTPADALAQPAGGAGLRAGGGGGWHGARSEVSRGVGFILTPAGGPTAAALRGQDES